MPSLKNNSQQLQAKLKLLLFLLILSLVWSKPIGAYLIFGEFFDIIIIDEEKEIRPSFSSLHSK